MSDDGGTAPVKCLPDLYRDDYVEVRCDNVTRRGLVLRVAHQSDDEEESDDEVAQRMLDDGSAIIQWYDCKRFARFGHCF